MLDRRSPWRLLVVVSLLVLTAGLARRSRTASSPSPAPDPAEPSGTVSLPRAPEPVRPEESPRANPPDPSPSTRTVYRFQIEDDRCELLAAEPIQGDFRRRTVSRRQPGMLRCRLVDAEQRVLAEEFLPQPDFHCVVLDPVAPSSTSNASPARLTGSGPVVVQTRLAASAPATTLEIGRIDPSPDEAPDSVVVRTLARFPLSTQP